MLHIYQTFINISINDTAIQIVFDKTNIHFRLFRPWYTRMDYRIILQPSFQTLGIDVPPALEFPFSLIPDIQKYTSTRMSEKDIIECHQTFLLSLLVYFKNIPEDHRHDCTMPTHWNDDYWEDSENTE